MDTQGPAQTLNYMIAGYAVFFSVLAIYLISLVVRWRNLRQDEAMLEHMEAEQEQPGKASKNLVDNPQR